MAQHPVPERYALRADKVHAESVGRGIPTRKPAPLTASGREDRDARFPTINTILRDPAKALKVQYVCVCASGWASLKDLSCAPAPPQAVTAEHTAADLEELPAASLGGTGGSTGKRGPAGSPPGSQANSRGGSALATPGGAPGSVAGLDGSQPRPRAASMTGSVAGSEGMGVYAMEPQQRSRVQLSRCGAAWADVRRQVH